MREAATKVLPENKFAVLKQETVYNRLGGQKKYLDIVCTETNCILNLGKKAKVDYVAQCRVMQDDGRYWMTVELYEVSSERQLGAFTRDAMDFDDLTSLIDKEVSAMFLSITKTEQEIIEQEMERKCRNKSGMVWYGDKCITNKHAECLEKNHIWIEKDNYCRDRTEHIAAMELEGKRSKAFFYTAVALDALGAGFLIYGLINNFQANSKYDDYKSLEGVPRSQYDSAWKDVTDAQSRRNLFYILGATSLGLGVGVHIVF
jgi:hypothetical protein